MSNAFLIIKMCYVHNQWYDISWATLYLQNCKRTVKYFDQKLYNYHRDDSLTEKCKSLNRVAEVHCNYESIKNTQVYKSRPLYLAQHLCGIKSYCLSTACRLLFNHLEKWKFYLKIIFGRKMLIGVSSQLFPK